MTGMGTDNAACNRTFLTSKGALIETSKTGKVPLSKAQSIDKENSLGTRMV